MGILEIAIKNCLSHSPAFCKFISANDAGATGAHQSGLYIPKEAWSILFDSPGTRGKNKDRFVTIKWQDDFETESRFIYYGQRTRNEYRITRFGRGFPYLQSEYVGALFILVQISSDYYHGYVLESDEEIESFFASVGISASETNALIGSGRSPHPPNYESLFAEYIASLSVYFPETTEVSRKAREFHGLVRGNDLRSADSLLLGWLDTEYALFRAIEQDRYKERIRTPFTSVEELVECANTLLNRRKSRAGKSLEHHLSEVFTLSGLSYGTQTITEGNKKPDFIFPGGEAYHDPDYDEDRLLFLGAKTTCKDRWRQILNEADRIPVKHLFTLQQGISENQLREMYSHGVVLVVPKPYIGSFPAMFRDRIVSLDSFVSMARAKCYT